MTKLKQIFTAFPRYRRRRRLTAAGTGCVQRDTEQYVIMTAVLIKLSGTADGVQSVARSADPHQYCNALH
jgi:hypothetical protein